MGFPSSAQAAATGSRLSFEAVFLPYVLTSDGRPLIERVSELQPKADAPKVVQNPTQVLSDEDPGTPGRGPCFSSGLRAPDPHILIPAASSSRTPPLQPRASARSRGSADDLRSIGWSTAMAPRPARLRPS